MTDAVTHKRVAELRVCTWERVEHAAASLEQASLPQLAFFSYTYTHSSSKHTQARASAISSSRCLSTPHSIAMVAKAEPLCHFGGRYVSHLHSALPVLHKTQPQ